MNQFGYMFRSMPPVTKNLIIINVIVWLAMFLSPTINANAMKFLALHYIEAPDFNLAQLVTYMFLHGGFFHMFFNMFVLWMFGMAIENTMDSKRFLIFYMVCGIGAGLIQELVWSFTLPDMIVNGLASQNHETAEYIRHVIAFNPEIMASNLNFFTTVGASGAIYGVLLAFGMLFPNRPLYFLFVPVPIKAKWMVLIWGVLELLLGLSAADSVAHFAHLGGMIFGFLLIIYWKKKGLIHGDTY